jgi:Tol biopolymer transport system component
MEYRHRWLLLGLVLGLVSGCGGGNERRGATVSEVQITAPPIASLKVSSSMALAVTVRDLSGVVVPEPAVTWRSSNNSVLTVSASGVATALAPGTATVSAAMGGRVDSITLRCAESRSLQIAAPTYALQPGGSTQLRMLAKDSADADLWASANWTSAQPEVASVSADGLVSALAPGVTLITASVPSRPADERTLRISVQAPVHDKIAFVSARGQIVFGRPIGGIFLMNLDGSEQQLLIESVVEHCGDRFQDTCAEYWGKPAWNADGMRLATSSTRTFAVEQSGPMIFLCASGAQPSCNTLTPFPARNDLFNFPIFPLLGLSPAWSPDGKRLAFAHEIWEAFSHTFTPLPSFAYAEPVWAPDGVRLAFVHQVPGGGQLDIWVANSDGSGPVQLTGGPGDESSPQWSPDGTRIAFVSNRDGNKEIYVMNADGTGLLNLTANSGNDASPSWSPDGLRIAFQSDRDGDNEIYVMNADGSNPVNLTNDPAEDTQPAWSP